MVLAAVISAGTVLAQDKSERPSPPAQATAVVGGVKVTIDYSQPALKERKFGSEEFHPYGKIWRNGANEATWIEISGDVTINGTALKKGKYGFFVIPGQTVWTLVFNSVWDQWGAYEYNKAKDVMRVSARVDAAATFSERYTITLDDTGNGSMNWGDFSVSFQVAAQ